MLKSITDYFKSLFNPDQVVEDNRRYNTNDEVKWVREELEKWKVEMYTNNKSLQNIPNSKILEKKEKLKREYRLRISY